MSIQSIGNNAQPGVATNNSATKTDATLGTVSTSAVPASGSITSKAPPTTEQVNKAVDALNKSVQATVPSIEFATDATSKRMVVKIIDQQTNEVIMQIPNQEVIDMSQSLDKLQGLLVKLKA
jgi:flagellar protein FlaG